MRKRLTYVFLLVCTLALTVLVVFFTAQQQTSSDVSFVIDNMHIEIYEENENTCHVFLPAYCDWNAVRLRTSQPVYLDGIELKNGDALPPLETEKDHTLQVDGHVRSVRFWQAENVATVYLDTRSGSMEQIHADKDHREAASVTVYTQEGEVDCSGMVCTLKGRGNATWQCRKKPYSLQLSRETDLLGMGKGQDWILLANAFDQSNLYTSIIFDLAQQTGFAWTPEYRYVELYLNGSYNGLYLLVEKIQCSESRLQLDLNNGDFLGRIEPRIRWPILDDPIFTRQGRVMEICQPQLPTKQRRAEIEALTAHLEELILSAPQNALPEEFDVDSWARRYLIDEIFANIDADLASSYFYYHNGVFYAGPLWDYDMVLGNQICNENPRGFVAKNLNRSASFQTPYDTALLNNAVFYDRVTQLYQTQFLPELETLLRSDIARRANEIDGATRMNTRRWQEMFEKNPVTASDAEKIRNYLQSRVAFLTDVWVEGIPYCSVQFEIMPGSSYWNTSVEYGQCLQREELGLSEAFAGMELADPGDEALIWTDLATGEVFDFREPVVSDHILVLQTKEAAEAENVTQPEQDQSVRTVVVTLTVLVLLLAGLLVVDFCRRRQERRRKP